MIGLSVACGCGGPDKSGSGTDDKTPGKGGPGASRSGAVSADDLKQLTIAFHKFSKKFNHRRAPSGWAELTEFATSNGMDSAALQRVRDARYTVYWDTPIRGVKIGLSNFVLAYRTSDVATGGLVAMYDGSAKQLSGAVLKTLLARQDPTMAVGELDPVPSGGKVVKLGDGRLALKVMYDKQGDIVIAYLIDGAGRRRIATDATRFTVKMNNRILKFDGDRDELDPAGKFTRFAATLANDIAAFRKGGPAQFEVEINGQKLQGTASF